MKIRSSTGFSSIELVIVAVLVLVMSGAVAMMVVRAQKAHHSLERNALVTSATQDLLEQMREDVGSSTRLLHNDTDGNAYLAGLDRSSLPGLAGARLPTLDVNATFKKDVVGGEKTGNVLLFIAHDRTRMFDIGMGGPAEEVRIDVYRLVAYYLRKMKDRDPSASVDGLDVVRWISAPLVDGDQVDRIADPAKKEALLVHFFEGTNQAEPQFPYPAARLLYRLGGPFPNAFEEIRADGTTSAVPAGFKISMDADRSKPTHLEHRRLSIATNQASTRGVGRFGRIDGSGDGFPHGLEIQMIGPTSARQVLIHLTVVSMDADSERAWLDVQGISDVRDR